MTPHVAFISRGIIKYTPTDPLGQSMAAGRPNLVLGHQMPASNDLGQPSYTTAEEKEQNKKKLFRCDVNRLLHFKHHFKPQYHFYHVSQVHPRSYILRFLSFLGTSANRRSIPSLKVVTALIMPLLKARLSALLCVKQS